MLACMHSFIPYMQCHASADVQGYLNSVVFVEFFIQI